MRNLRNRYSYQTRLEFQETITKMRVFILPLLLQKQNNACNICKKSYKKYEIDHLVYNPMVTINELQALCVDCHYNITDYTTIKNKNNPSNRYRVTRKVLRTV